MKLSVKSFLSRAELTQKQKQLDINQDGEISSDDLKKLREGKKPGEASAFLSRASSTVVAAPSPAEMIQALKAVGVKDAKKLAKGLFVDSPNELAFEFKAAQAEELSAQISSVLGPVVREKGSLKTGPLVRVWRVKGKGRVTLEVNTYTGEASLHLYNK